MILITKNDNSIKDKATLVDKAVEIRRWTDKGPRYKRTTMKCRSIDGPM